MQKVFIGILVIMVVLVVFTLLNDQAVLIDFGFFMFRAALSLVIIITFVLGALVSLLVSIPVYRKKQRLIKSLKEEIQQLKDINSTKAISIDSEDVSIVEDSTPDE